MAAIPISISGILYDKTARTQQRVYLIGNAQIVGLSVGGGPIVPPEEVEPPDPGGPGGQPPHPAFPIWGPPGTNFPDKPGYPPVAGWPPDFFPLPPQFPNPPDPDNATVVKPPPESGGWGWGQGPGGTWSWFFVPGSATAGPKSE